MYQTEGKTKDPYLSKGKDGVIRTLYNCQGCYGTFLAPIIKGKVHLCSSCQRGANTIKEGEMRGMTKEEEREYRAAIEKFDNTPCIRGKSHDIKLTGICDHCKKKFVSIPRGPSLPNGTLMSVWEVLGE